MAAVPRSHWRIIYIEQRGLAIKTQTISCKPTAPGGNHSLQFLELVFCSSWTIKNFICSWIINMSVLLLLLLLLKWEYLRGETRTLVVSFKDLTGSSQGQHWFVGRHCAKVDLAPLHKNCFIFWKFIMIV